MSEARCLALVSQASNDTVSPRLNSPHLAWIIMYKYIAGGATNTFCTLRVGNGCRIQYQSCLTFGLLTKIAGIFEELRPDPQIGAWSWSKSQTAVVSPMAAMSPLAAASPNGVTKECRIMKVPHHQMVLRHQRPPYCHNWLILSVTYRIQFHSEI